MRGFAHAKKNMKKTLTTVVIAVLAGTLSACSAIPRPFVPVAVEQFPFQWKFVAEDDEPELQLCWVEKEQTVGCLDWPSSIKTKEDRNNFQHALFGIATSLCSDFRATLANQPKKALWVGIVSELLSAASPVISDETRSRVVAAAGSFTSITASEMDGYLDADKIEIALLGIELARTDIFKKVLESANEDLSEYPVNRAINDAMRYHGVCNLQDGLSTSADAVGDQIGS